MGKYPQESYAIVVCVIQFERTFFQFVTKDTGHSFSFVEKFLQETFLPRNFYVKSKSLTPIIVTFSTIPVKKFILGIKDLVTLANKKYVSLIRGRSDLIGDVLW